MPATKEVDAATHSIAIADGLIGALNGLPANCVLSALIDVVANALESTDVPAELFAERVDAMRKAYRERCSPRSTS
jgi:hypothetical protein